MARPMKPLVKSGGYYPSNRWIPLVYPGGYTTMQGEGGEPTPSVVWVTVSGSSPLALANAAASNIRSLVQYGKCVQSGTPTPDAPADIVCNNGVLKYGATGGIIVDGTPETLTVGGKNAFNADITSGRSISAQGSITITPNRSATENGVPVIGGEDYVLSYAETFKNGVFFYDADDVFVSYLAWGNAPRAFTAPSNARFVRFSFYDATPPTNVQLELGSTATAYEPYRTPQTATVEDLFGVGDHKDAKDIISGAITRRVGFKVLTGDEELSTTTVGYYRFVSTEHIPSALAVCTHLVGVSSGSIPATADREGTVWLGSNWIGLGLRTRFATVADFKAYLAEQYAAGTPVIVLYPLAEEITESVTPQPLKSYNGTNVVEAATNVDPVNLSVEYAQPESGGS